MAQLFGCVQQQSDSIVWDESVKYLSLFSGIEACSVAWKPLGWHCVGVSEIEPFPCAVLVHHYPNAPNLGDVTEITEERIKALGSIDVVVGGSPCQDLSVAGKRKGMINADGTITRSGLFYNQYNIFKWAQKHCGARFLLWENVPGAFSSSRGRDFASVVELMAGLDNVDTPPYGWGYEGVALGENGLLEWATLDAQYFGVAQRRRRVFALLDAGDWKNRPPILLERQSVRGDTAPSRSAGQEIAGCPRSSLASGKPTTGTLMANAGTKLWLGNQEAFSGDYRVLHQVYENHAADSRITPVEISPTLTSAESGSNRTPALLHGMAVRRLTPIECERLQGFPDNYTDIKLNGKPAHDGSRYKALGNSMAVPVMQWIGKQIQKAREQ